MLCRLLRAPGSWLALTDYASLDLVALPSILLLGDLCLASRARAATETLQSWRAMEKALRETAARCLSLEALGHGRAWPAFWEARPLATVLAEAAALLEVEPSLQSALLEAEERRGEGRKPRLQAALTRALAAPARRAALAARPRERLRKWFSVPSLSLASLDLDSLRSFLDSLPPAWRWALFKTWTGGWVTDTRLRNPQLGCLLGCSGALDSLSHYITCSRMDELLTRVSGCPAPSDLLARLALVGHSTDAARMMVMRFHLHRHLHQLRKRGPGGIISGNQCFECARAARAATDLPRGRRGSPAFAPARQRAER